MVKKRPHPTHWAVHVRTRARCLLRVRGLPRRVVVAGSSMSPVVEAGDRLVVVPTAAVRPGELVAVLDPRLPDRILIKRVHAVDADGIELRGDNPEASTDSRHFGRVPPGAVLGRAVYRYHPADRSGWIHE